MRSGRPLDVLLAKSLLKLGCNYALVSAEMASRALFTVSLCASQFLSRLFLHRFEK